MYCGFGVLFHKFCDCATSSVSVLSCMGTVDGLCYSFLPHEAGPLILLTSFIVTHISFSFIFQVIPTYLSLYLWWCLINTARPTYTT